MEEQQSLTGEFLWRETDQAVKKKSKHFVRECGLFIRFFLTGLDFIFVWITGVVDHQMLVLSPGCFVPTDIT
jgi:hypothetical protein